MQTGTGLPLNAFRWASSAPNKVGVATVNNTAGTLFGRSRGPRHRAAMRATTVESAALICPEDEVVVLLGGGEWVPAAIDEAAVQAGVGPIPYD